jgi:hypothetical protein
MGVSGGGDLMQTIVNIMKEMQKKNKFIHKQDIYAVVSGNVDNQTFERSVERLLQDGTIYSTYDPDVLTLE